MAFLLLFQLYFLIIFKGYVCIYMYAYYITSLILMFVIFSP